MDISFEELKQLAKHSFEWTGHNSKFTKLDALIVWQHVRFNKKYRKQYKKLVADVTKTQNEDFEDFEVQSFCSCWGISDRLDFNTQKPPQEFYFDLKVVRQIDNLKKEAYLFDWHQDPSSPEIIVAINTQADSKLILKEIESLLDDEHQTWSRYVLRPATATHVVDNFICFHLKEVMKLKNKDVKTKYKEIYPGSDLQDQQIKAKIESFRVISDKSPWCFITAYK